ncbi:hypothetical protein R3P38DRAFT_2607420 [Favolaschia claudopus]|uniref:BTB domain-containing protein n=1 Tax=Favolaschia claudopus TaxID=2862362 RepID=A0AAW0D659_9AGAR
MNPLAYKRVEDLWFYDGSLILRAGEKIFRVYKAQLAARSTVFETMLELGTPDSQTDEMIDGVPVAVLHDEADDVEVFLRAIFDSSFFMPSPAAVRLADVMAILRLAHKYDVDYLHRRALEHLAFEYYYASVDAFGKSFRETESKETVERSTHFLHAGSHDRIPVFELLKLLTAAEEVGAIWILPIIYYDLTMQCKLQDILSALEQAGNERLTRTCLGGRSQLLLENLRLNRFLVEETIQSDCLQPTACDPFRRFLCDAVFEALLGQQLAPLDGLGNSIWDDVDPAKQSHDPPSIFASIFSFTFCVPCFNASRAMHTAAREDCWNNLPRYFGLPSWPELQAMKDAALGSDD